MHKGYEKAKVQLIRRLQSNAEQRNVCGTVFGIYSKTDYSANDSPGIIIMYSLHSTTTVQRFTAGRAPGMSPNGSNVDDALQDRAAEVGGAHMQTDAKNTTSNDVIILYMKKLFPR